MQISKYNSLKLDAAQMVYVDEVIDIPFEELQKHIINNAWSPFIFNADITGNPKRENKYFKSTSLIGIDIDSGLSINEAQSRLNEKGFAYLIGTTKSHQKQKGKHPPCDRFRIILKTEQLIESKSDFSATLASLAILFPEMDKACKDTARFFYPCENIVVIKDGLSVPVVKDIPKTEPAKIIKSDGIPAVKGKLRNTTNNFVIHGAPEGQWHNALIKAVYDLKTKNYTMEESIDLLQKAAIGYKGELDSQDLFHIQDIYLNRRVEKIVSERRRLEGVVDGMTVDEIFLAYSTQFNLKYNKAWSGLTINMGGAPENYTQSQFENRILLDLNSSGVQKFDKDLMKRRISVYIDEQEKLCLERKKEELAFDPLADKTGFDKFIYALCGPDNPKHELDVAVLQHLIWQGKRKMNDLPVEHHMMPVIVGQQGTGKSVAVSHLLSPVSEFVGAPPDLATLNDPRCSAFFFKYLFLFFDEMARAQRADINRLKNLISSATIEYRPLHSNGIDTRKNMATFLGCSNIGVAETIHDTTGVRRFWEINVRKRDTDWEETSRLVWAPINSIDYHALWKSIDELEPSPIIPYLVQIKEYQDTELRNKDSVELFLEQGEVESLPSGSSRSNWVTSSEVYTVYNMFCEKMGIDPLSCEYMCRRLKSLNISVARTFKGKRYAIKLLQKLNIG